MAIETTSTFSEGDSGEGLEKMLSIPYPRASYVIAALPAAALFGILKQDDTFFPLYQA